MQTFLPYQCPKRTAACLDYRRLGKQRVEVLQILRALNGETRGWRNHPATRMWQGYERFLVWYGRCICDHWISRGYKDTCRSKILVYTNRKRIRRPPWLTTEFCMAHRSALLRKDFSHYRSYFGHNFPTDIPLVWPVT